MHVAINLPIVPGGASGGVEQFLIGLVSGLGEIDDSNEYVLVTNPRNPEWIRPYASDDMEITPRPWSGMVERLRATLHPIEPLVRPLVEPILDRTIADSNSIPSDDGFFKGLGVNVVHFPTQHYVRTDLPCLFNPHDLQHEHYPEYFSPEQLAERRALYRTACTEATAIDVPSHFVRQDLINTYDVSPEKIYAIDRGPPVTTYREPTDADLETVRADHSLPSTFVLYPAKSWPHKNHLNLIEGIAKARDTDGTPVQLVCTGKRTDHWETVRRRIRDLDLTDQVDHLGFVSPVELRTLYRLATAVVIPSLFEGGGFPLLEAWSERTPVACSNTTALREKAGDAAHLFDPIDSSSIATALSELVTDPALRGNLRDSGANRVESFTWEKTARTYCALYRKAGGGDVSERHEEVLETCKK